MQSNNTPPHAASGGTLHRWRVRWFGERDAVDAQLADIARQGAGMARLAHACAFAMIVLFSAGSLVTLSGDAVAAVARSWSTGGAVNVPQAISVAVSGLLVLCLDTGMLLAASTLRMLRSRRASWSERWVHVAIMCGVALVEASTYALMSVTYDHPASRVAWAIILARSLSAPILSVYLALAQPLPVGPRDILAQVELASGAAVLRDVVTIAHDATATLEHKVRLYDASAVAPESERERLARLIAVTREETPAMLPAAPTLPTSEANTPPDRPPTGPGTPLRRRGVQTPNTDTPPAIIRLDPPRRRTAAQARAGRAHTQGRRTGETAETKVRRVWRPEMSISQLERAADVSRSTAHKWRKVLAAEASGQVAQ